MDGLGEAVEDGLCVSVPATDEAPGSVLAFVAIWGSNWRKEDPPSITLPFKTNKQVPLKKINLHFVHIFQSQLLLSSG